MAKETLGAQVGRFQAAQNKTRNTDHPAADPMIYPAYLPTQNAVDRARTSARAACAAPKPTSTKCRRPAAKHPKSPPEQFEPNLSRFPSPNPSLPSANPSIAAPSGSPDRQESSLAAPDPLTSAAPGFFFGSPETTPLQFETTGPMRIFSSGSCGPGGISVFTLF
jgi:hypothetical protein